MFAKALWSIGFRPFFAFGSAYSLIIIFVWSLVYTGKLSFQPALVFTSWHAHEMLFGFVMAIVAGFLLTATANWTGLAPVQGKKLQCLFFLWLLARVLSFSFELSALYTVVDLLFIPYLTWQLWPYLTRPEQRRNLIFFAYFALLFIATVLSHFNVSVFNLPSRAPYVFALFLMLGLVVVIAGRIIPFFTQKVIPNASVTMLKPIEKASQFSLLVFALVYLLFPQSVVTAILAFVIFLEQTLRWMLWRPWQSLKIPILFVLHIAYLFLPIGFLLQGFEVLGWIGASIPIHVFSIGCIGLFIIGMINRVSLGHTGRPIKASKLMILAYILVLLALLVRTLLVFLVPGQLLLWIRLSGSLWSMAFAIFLFVIGPKLFKPRL